VGEPNFTCDLSGNAEALPHFWEHCVGSGHATLALRADYQKQLTRCHRELGFKHVRFHGLMDDEMGTLVCENDKLVYSFYNADTICDFLLSIGMRPFMELSFMPTTLASGKDTVFHYGGNVTPPSDYQSWATLIEKLVGHWSARYGFEEVKKWFFEVWNEPNLKAFWTGTQEDYFKLYEVTARAIKKIHPSLQVGGPATAMNAWVPEFLAFCEKNKVPADFVTTHHYPTDAFGKPGDDTVTQLAASKRSVLRDEAKKVVEAAKGKPVYYTEWSTSSNPFDELHDEAYASAFITKTVLEARGLVKGYSYWVFSDIFEENYFASKPFHGGFGLMNIYGVPKPAYRAYEILHRLGEEMLPVSGNHATVDVWLTRKENLIQIVVNNSALPRHAIKTESVTLTLQGVDNIQSAFIERIDDHHANATRAWKKMGSPESLTPYEVSTLELASKLVAEPIEIHYQNKQATLQHSGVKSCVKLFRVGSRDQRNLDIGFLLLKRFREFCERNFSGDQFF
jgi:xylan 1,4-beta-xylosidase